MVKKPLKLQDPNKWKNRVLFMMFFFLALFILGLDQGSKSWILELFKLGFFKEPITPFFNIVARWNKGVSFGLLGHHGLSPWVFIFLTLLISLGLFVWFLKERTLFMAGVIGMVLGGALSNAYDRFIRGAVFDFLEFHWEHYYWPAFNLADSVIVIGVSLLFLKSLIKTKKDKEPYALQRDGK